jgi:prophage regulatory protein
VLFHQAMPKPAPQKATPVFYRLRDVVRITALSRATLYRRISEGRFPAPVHLGGKASAWRGEALQAWIDDPDRYRSATPPK